MFGFSVEDYRPFQIVTYHVDQTNDDNFESGPNIIIPNGRQSNEEILFAGFLSDFDPSLIFVVTYDKARQTSYMKVLKIERNEDTERGISFYEE